MTTKTGGKENGCKGGKRLLEEEEEEKEALKR